MNYLDILFTKSKDSFSPLSDLIRIVDQTPYSHVAFKWPHSKLPFQFTYESKLNGGVNYTDETLFDEHNQIVMRYRVFWNDNQKDRFTFICSKMSRKFYGITGVIGMGIMRIFKFLGGRTNNPFPIGMFCSQAASVLLQYAFSFNFGEESADIGPRELEIALDHIMKNSSTKIIKLME